MVALAVQRRGVLLEWVCSEEFGLPGLCSGGCDVDRKEWH